MKSKPASEDAPVIASLRALGADVFATTSLLEYAAGATHPDVPEAMNPYNSKRTAGGSSGGSASLVGAGVCSVAIGTDTGGSIRIPAHYCAVVGFKPSYNSIPLTGVTPLSPTFDHVGLLASDVEVTRKVFSALVGKDEKITPSKISGLKIGIIASHFDLPQLNKEVADSVKTTLDKLKSLGASVVEIDDDVFKELEKTFEDMLLFEAWQVHGEKVTNDPTHYGPETLRLFQAAKATTRSEFESAAKRRNELLPLAAAMYDAIDVIVTPAAPYVAPATTPPMDTPDGAVEGAYTAIFNITGDPAIVIPCGLNSEGLPIGIQLATVKGSDFRLLSIAQAVETALALKLAPKN
jgi:Asp-tRNA(Asn)/Glu-tRNA(Gln) amidotransferase A subunit family amidase